jgi:hypothetical protein
VVREAECVRGWAKDAAEWNEGRPRPGEVKASVLYGLPYGYEGCVWDGRAAANTCVSS